MISAEEVLSRSRHGPWRRQGRRCLRLGQGYAEVRQRFGLRCSETAADFFTYFPGFGIDPKQVANLDHLYTGKTHHLHGTPAFWRSPALGPMLFVWGENECLRAWTLGDNGE
jgi:hypothetical protein